HLIGTSIDSGSSTKHLNHHRFGANLWTQLCAIKTDRKEEQCCGYQGHSQVLHTLSFDLPGVAGLWEVPMGHLLGVTPVFYC
ncbi:MAG: hypothetical protein Q8P67_03790, partial [archaeon]|nr:hypothetical protein [archaeon]